MLIDRVNRQFDCSLASMCQRSNPFATNGACVVLVAMIAMKTHHCSSRYFLTYM